jgi:hypothetical protein
MRAHRRAPDLSSLLDSPYRRDFVALRHRQPRTDASVWTTSIICDGRPRSRICSLQSWDSRLAGAHPLFIVTLLLVICGVTLERRTIRSNREGFR